MTSKVWYHWEFSDGLVGNIPGFHCHGPGSIPGRGPEVPQATWRSQKKKKKKYDTISVKKKKQTNYSYTSW